MTHPTNFASVEAFAVYVMTCFTNVFNAGEKLNEKLEKQLAFWIANAQVSQTSEQTSPCGEYIMRRNHFMFTYTNFPKFVQIELGRFLESKGAKNGTKAAKGFRCGNYIIHVDLPKFKGGKTVQINVMHCEFFKA